MKRHPAGVEAVWTSMTAVPEVSPVPAIWPIVNRAQPFFASGVPAELMVPSMPSGEVDFSIHMLTTVGLVITGLRWIPCWCS